MGKLNKENSNYNVILKLQNTIDQLLSSITCEEEGLKHISDGAKEMLYYMECDNRFSSKEYCRLKRSVKELLMAVSYKKIILKNTEDRIKEFTKSHDAGFSSYEKTRHKRSYYYFPFYIRW